MTTQLRSRDVSHELLDGERLDPRELRINLREMAMLNRLPGGTRDSLRATVRLLDGQSEASVLDIGTGSGDYARRLSRSRRAVRVIAADRSAEVLEVAARNLRDASDVSVIQADVRALPLDARSVHVAHASLLLHHLDPDEAVLALREMRRVARCGIVVNDLRRGRLAYLVTSATVLALSRGRYTRHDGVLSARRAYTLAELDELARRAGLTRAWRSLSALPRVTTVYT